MKSTLSSATLLFTLTLFCSNPAPLAAQSNTASPAQVPLFTLDDISGNRVSLEDYRGRVVMINFWATWCPPCVEEMPAMQALKASWADKPFEILAINMGESVSVIQAFIDRLEVDFDFPLLVDPETVVAGQYRVTGLPATLLIDKNGDYAFGGVGPRDWNSTEVRNEILPLIGD